MRSVPRSAAGGARARSALLGRHGGRSAPPATTAAVLPARAARPRHPAQATDPVHPAQVFFAIDGRGYEIIIDRLPVKMLLKSGLRLRAPADSPVTVGTFDNTKIDSFAYTLDDDTQPARDRVLRPPAPDHRRAT